MYENTPQKSHPLEIDDEDDFDTRPRSTDLSDKKSPEHKSFYIPKRNPEKRMAPKRPEEPKITLKIDENKLNNFFIDIDQVGWFFKGDKEPNQTATIPNNGTSATSLPSVQSSSNLLDQAPNENDINNNNNNNSNNLSNINVTRKKWHMFTKAECKGLELEYRDMISKKHLNIQCEPKLVPVLNNLYEVNLETKKCYPIYWKSSKTMSVMRCIWFSDSGEPFDERIGELIEKKHVELFKEQLSNETENSINNDFMLRAPSPEGDEAAKSSKSEAAKPLECNVNYLIEIMFLIILILF